MPSYFDILQRKSFEDIPGEDYNQYRQDVFERVGHSYLFYEISLMKERPWEFLRDSVYPAFARYLKAKFYDPEKSEKIVVAVFHTERCYLLAGNDFLEVYREMEGLDPDELSSTVSGWLEWEN
jgi:hypothetical protein